MERTKQTALETPSVNPTAEKLKEEGNAYFRDGNYAQAYESYSKALNVDPHNPNNYMYYCNRATASYYLKHYDESVAGTFCVPLSRRLREEYQSELELREGLRAPGVLAEQAEPHRGGSQEVLIQLELNGSCKLGLQLNPQSSVLQSLLRLLQGAKPQQPAPSASSVLQNMATNPDLQDVAKNVANGSMSLQDAMKNPAVQSMWARGAAETQSQRHHEQPAGDEQHDGTRQQLHAGTAGTAGTAAGTAGTAAGDATAAAA